MGYEWKAKGYPAELMEAGLSSFENFWELPEDWIEPPNYRRNGWSGVTRISLPTRGNSSIEFYVKRQHRHLTRSMPNLLESFPTLRREWHNLQFCARNKIPVIEPLFYGESDNHRAIMVTLGLQNHTDLDDFLAKNTHLNSRRHVTRKIGEVAARLHGLSKSHGCFYGKHIFVQSDAGLPEITLLDLEKMRPIRFNHQQKAAGDISQLIRHTKNMTPDDIKVILHGYGCKNKLGQSILKHIRNRRSVLSSEQLLVLKQLFGSL